MTTLSPADVGSPNKQPRHSRRLSDELVEEARELFQERTETPLTPEDARQMLENLVGFFSVLIEWDREAVARSLDAGDDTNHRNRNRK